VGGSSESQWIEKSIDPEEDSCPFNMVIFVIIQLVFAQMRILINVW